MNNREIPHGLAPIPRGGEEEKRATDYCLEEVRKMEWKKAPTAEELKAEVDRCVKKQFEGKES